MFGQKRAASVMRRLLASGVFLLILSSTACAQSGGSDEPTAATSAPLQTTSREDAQRVVTETYTSFLAVSDAIAAQGGSDTTKLAQVAEGNALDEITESMGELSDAGLRITGATRLAFVEIAEWGDNRISAYICEDVGLVDLVDSQGKSLVSPDRIAVTPFEVELVRVGDAPFLLSERKVWTGKNFCS